MLDIITRLLFSFSLKHINSEIQLWHNRAELALLLEKTISFL